MDRELKEVKSVDGLEQFLIDKIANFYGIIKGVQATQKINKTYFDEIFKKADKNLVKIMSKNKNSKENIEGYVKGNLIDNLKKISGYKESEKEEQNEKESTEKEINKTEEQIKNLEEQKEFLFEAEEGDDNENLEKLKQVAKKWIANVFSPVFNTDAPTGGEEKKGFINFGGDYRIKRNVAQGIIRKSSFDDIKNLRDKVGNKSDFPIRKQKNL